ncbi:Wg004 [Wigglesworthia glossinidia endosymbiont of Glossina brevipalpis]|uniref:Wg004 protein n=1 Tax=Wigglesworthia glossinidia brevipalpis TaxID=36870 RepID=Q8D272_WIGBR|nr:Wg004 [Wigglesworthia glossinidia endosymbiont of Glossina brevipalpis]
MSFSCKIYLKIFFINLIFNTCLLFFHFFYCTYISENKINFKINDFTIGSINIDLEKLTINDIKYKNSNFDIFIKEYQFNFNKNLLDYEKSFSGLSSFEEITIKINSNYVFDFNNNVFITKLVKLMIKNIFMQKVKIYYKDLSLFFERINTKLIFNKNEVNIKYIDLYQASIKIYNLENLYENIKKWENIFVFDKVSFFKKNKKKQDIKYPLIFNNQLESLYKLFFFKNFHNKLNIKKKI